VVLPQYSFFLHVLLIFISNNNFIPLLSKS
jgi:hypothetical protein